MIQLITISDFSPYRHISSNIAADKKIDMYIIEAQQFDLFDLMGHDFFYNFIDEMANSPLDTAWDNLFNGVDYNEPSTGRLIKYEGIKPALIYFSYARYIGNANFTATAHNFVTKKDDWSEPVSEKTIGRLMTQANSAAMAYWHRVEKYLCDQRTLNPTYYTVWNECNTGIKNRTSTQISAIGKNN